MNLIKLLGDRVAVATVPAAQPETLGSEGLILASTYTPWDEEERVSNNDPVRTVTYVGTGPNVQGIQPGDQVVLDKRKGPHYDGGEYKIYGTEAIIGVIPAGEA